MKFLWRDDRNGKRSDTTFRTWIVFILVILYLIALCVLSIFSPDSLRPLHMDLIQWLVIFYGTAGSLYLGKRVNEDLNFKRNVFENVIETMNGSNDSGSFPKPDIKNEKL
ncbi:hypothetical protein JWG45_09970 [Leptospira sp. 201903070]|jgi:hypothetical protein|uniref:Uncharacterized protein n=1 Tax=Leptospira ainlahdjerensis TaxID=2810033 RepID=A0ABS2UD48_9LEPT|nr:hypothetical protein [Leptospira ainlahdjerensis]MBM9577478.1 hypothetical protein [Leptospira ainlahdjerensis]